MASELFLWIVSAACVSVLYSKCYKSYCNLDEKAWLLFANQHDIRKLEVDGMTMQTVVSELQNAVSVDYDYYNNLVFWSDINQERIMK